MAGTGGRKEKESPLCDARPDRSPPDSRTWLRQQVCDKPFGGPDGDCGALKTGRLRGGAGRARLAVIRPATKPAASRAKRAQWPATPFLHRWPGGQCARTHSAQILAGNCNRTDSAHDLVFAQSRTSFPADCCTKMQNNA